MSAKKPVARRPGETPALVNGAVVPVWVAVRVPKDAKAGLYKGEVTVQATGEKAVAVPVEVKVADYTLPDSQDNRTLVEILQSPETLAMEYKVPLWSDKHWDLIAQSFRLMADSGNRTLHIPLIAETNLGHEQTMVRWIKKGDAYEYDFSLLEKYLDTAQKNLGKPKLLILHVWDVYMMSKGAAGGWNNEREGSGQGGRLRPGADGHHVGPLRRQERERDPAPLPGGRRRGAVEAPLGAAPAAAGPARPGQGRDAGGS